jgi:hypothetical protein
MPSKWRIVTGSRPALLLSASFIVAGMAIKKPTVESGVFVIFPPILRESGITCAGFIAVNIIKRATHRYRVIFYGDRPAEIITGHSRLIVKKNYPP